MFFLLLFFQKKTVFLHPMKRDEIVLAFKKLSLVLQCYDIQCDTYCDEMLTHFHHAVIKAMSANVWFTQNDVAFALNQIVNMLKIDDVYLLFDNLNMNKLNIPKKVAILLDDETPFSNFTEFFAILMSGNTFVGKLHDNDQFLLPALSELLISIDSRFAEKIFFTNTHLANFDSIILSSLSDSDHIYDKYWSKYTHILKKKKKSIAIIKGDESSDDLDKLSSDIFTYFGKGNRSVSKIYIPHGYDINTLINSFTKYEYLKHHSRYFNNYEYNKSICLINKIPHYDNGFVILKESDDVISAISVLHYQEYFSVEELCKDIGNKRAEIETICCKDAFFDGSVVFGSSQSLTFRRFYSDLMSINELLS